MNYKHITFETHDSVALIKLNRPEKLNAFTLTMMEELCDAFDVIDGNDKIGATLITGSGRAFCAGADLSGGENTFVNRFDTSKEHPQDYNKDAGGILTLRMYSCLLYTSPSPRDRTRARMPSSA